jgi:hypothetical protein
MKISEPENRQSSCLIITDIVVIETGETDDCNFIENPGTSSF